MTSAVINSIGLTLDILWVVLLSFYGLPKDIRECRHIHRHSREIGNPKAIGSKCVFASYRILGSRFRGDDGKRGLETDILKLTTLPRRSGNILLSVGRSEEETKRWKRYDLISWFAMVMLVAGFGLQIFGNLLLMSTK